MTQVTVDAENLWYLLAILSTYLDKECKPYHTLDEHRIKGFCFQEYEIIKQMEQQIQEVI